MRCGDLIITCPQLLSLSPPIPPRSLSWARLPPISWYLNSASSGDPHSSHPSVPLFERDKNQDASEIVIRVYAWSSTPGYSFPTLLLIFQFWYAYDAPRFSESVRPSTTNIICFTSRVCGFASSRSPLVLELFARDTFMQKQNQNDAFAFLIHRSPLPSVPSSDMLFHI